MTPIFQVDGVTYHVTVPQGGLKRSGKVTDDSAAGRNQSGGMNRSIIGTYYNYSMQIDTSELDVASYDALFEVLTAPVDYHTITVPYGQSTLTFRAYTANVDDELLLVRDGLQLWGNMTFNFVAMKPNRRPA